MNDPIAYCSQLASTNHANGDLIAAAPDLLAQLEWLMERYAHDMAANMIEDREDTGHTLVDCRAAIAKAKGEPCPTE